CGAPRREYHHFIFVSIASQFVFGAILLGTPLPCTQGKGVGGEGCILSRVYLAEYRGLARKEAAVTPPTQLAKADRRSAAPGTAHAATHTASTRPTPTVSSARPPQAAAR